MRMIHAALMSRDGIPAFGAQRQSRPGCRRQAERDSLERPVAAREPTWQRLRHRGRDGEPASPGRTPLIKWLPNSVAFVGLSGMTFGRRFIFNVGGATAKPLPNLRQGFGTRRRPISTSAGRPPGPPSESAATRRTDTGSLATFCRVSPPSTAARRPRFCSSLWLGAGRTS